MFVSNTLASSVVLSSDFYAYFCEINCCLVFIFWFLQIVAVADNLFISVRFFERKCGGCFIFRMVELDPLLLGSVSFLLTALTFIIIRIIKLYNDETRAHQRTEAILAMAAQDTRRERTEREPLG